MQENQLKTKSFWERPEGTTGMVVIGLGLAVLFFLGDTLLRLFTTGVAILGQAITLTILGAILFGIIMILTNKKFQTLISYGFKSVMRKITGAFVEIDPIGIMKSYIEDLTNKRSTMEESISKLRGQIRVCETQVGKNESDYETEMSKFKVARQKGMESAAKVSSLQAGRLEKLNNESLKPLLFQMQAHLRALNKYYEVTGTVIEDLNNEVKAQEIQRKMISESHSAMSAAKKILMGGTDERELFDQAAEFLLNDYGVKMGEIENFIENSKPFVEGLDIQNGVYEAEALKKLQEWENKADSILMGNQKQQILEQQTMNSPIYNGTGAPVAQFDFSQLLDNNRK